MTGIIGERPAFPVNQDEDDYQGLTKRQYFAALAMQGILANSREGNYHEENAPGAYVSEMVAKAAIEHADALIKAL